MGESKKKNGAAAGKSRKKRVTFKYQAPEAGEVVVTGSFCAWDEEAYPMRPTRKGEWQRAIYLEPGRYEYRFIVDGKWRNDPRCSELVPNLLGSANSVLEVEG